MEQKASQLKHALPQQNYWAHIPVDALRRRGDLNHVHVINNRGQSLTENTQTNLILAYASNIPNINSILRKRCHILWHSKRTGEIEESNECPEHTLRFSDDHTTQPRPSNVWDVERFFISCIAMSVTISASAAEEPQFSVTIYYIENSRKCASRASTSETPNLAESNHRKLSGYNT